MLKILLLIICLRDTSLTVTVVHDFYWRDYIPGDIPCDAFKGAPGRYIGEMFVKTGQFKHVAPGTIYPHSKCAVAEWNGKQIAKDHIKILCSSDNSRFYWKTVNNNEYSETATIDAVKGGYDDVHYIYIGKVFHEGEWKISKVVFDTDNTGSYYTWDQNGAPVKYTEFLMLKYNKTRVSVEECNTSSKSFYS